MKKLKPYSLMVMAAILIVGCEPTTVQPAPASSSAPPEQAGQAPPASEQSKVDDNLLRRNFYIVFDGSGSMVES
jgi:PBP1b-binding outer membrane lipoprotein LpoB